MTDIQVGDYDGLVLDGKAGEGLAALGTRSVGEVVQTCGRTRELDLSCALGGVVNVGDGERPGQGGNRGVLGASNLKGKRTGSAIVVIEDGNILTVVNQNLNEMDQERLVHDINQGANK